MDRDGMIQRSNVPHTFREYAEKKASEEGLTWTEHALERAWERKVDPDHVIRVGLNPDSEIIKKMNGRRYVQCWGRIKDGRTVYVCMTIHQNVIISAGWKRKKDQTGKF